MPPKVKTAADAVVEFALISLQPQFLRWDKNLNLGMAEMVWNFHVPGRGPGVIGTCDRDLDDLMRVLLEARTTRWGHLDFMVYGLGVRHEAGEIVFSFDLSWDEGLNFQRCEMVWDGPTADVLEN